MIFYEINNGSTTLQWWNPTIPHPSCLLQLKKKEYVQKKKNK